LIFDSMDEPPPYLPEGVKENLWPHELPIAITVAWRNNRIEHQEGTFTYHGKNKSPLNQLVPESVEKVIIDNDEIDDLLAHLRHGGFTHHHMLQDPDSLGRDIKEEALRSDLLWGAGVPPFTGDTEADEGSFSP
jgi:hypothetical protein